MIVMTYQEGNDDTKTITLQLMFQDTLIRPFFHITETPNLECLLKLSYVNFLKNLFVKTKYPQ